MHKVLQSLYEDIEAKNMHVEQSGFLHAIVANPFVIILQSLGPKRLLEHELVVSWVELTTFASPEIWPTFTYHHDLKLKQVKHFLTHRKNTVSLAPGC